MGRGERSMQIADQAFQKEMRTAEMVACLVHNAVCHLHCSFGGDPCDLVRVLRVGGVHGVVLMLRATNGDREHCGTVVHFRILGHGEKTSGGIEMKALLRRAVRQISSFNS